MKKFVITLFMFFPIFAYGENMCVKDGSIMVILDPNIAGTTSSYDDNLKTWSVQFSYGEVSGIARCHNTGSNSDTGAVAPNQDAIGNPAPGSGYCRCKMLRPVESLFIIAAQSYQGSCGGCASKCADFVKGNFNMRRGMFGNPVQ